MKKRYKITTLGGGTGHFVTLRGLKDYPVDISAIVSMADDGGSTGVLRDELGVLPAGDVRQCIVSLSDASLLMRNLMNYRFDSGSLKGHSFGNIFLSAFEKVTGSFEKGVEEVSRILNIQGKVLPVTNQQVRLKMVLNSRKLLDGEREIYLSQEIDQGFKSMYLDPVPNANPHAIKEILEADLVVIAPGGFYTSILPILLVNGVVEALKKTKAKKVFILNLMNRKGQTTHFKVEDYINYFNEFSGTELIDHVLMNSQKPSDDLIEIYREEGELVQLSNEIKSNVIRAPLLGEVEKEDANDFLIKRNLIRHDSKKLANEIMKILKMSIG